MLEPISVRFLTSRSFEFAKVGLENKRRLLDDWIILSSSFLEKMLGKVGSLIQF